MTRSSPTKRASAGFTLMEAMLAAAVLGFGLLAVGRMQIMLIADSDLAKQRTEAVQLGEKKIEELRSFSRLAAAAGKFAYVDIVSSSDTVTGSSAVYTRRWDVTDAGVLVGAALPSFKAIAMTVSWDGRSGAPEAVRMNSLIALADPAASGLASVPPGGTPTRTPKNRNINIPWPAVKLGGGISAFRPPGAPSTTAIILNDLSGAVSSTCINANPPSSDNTSGTPTNTSTWSCTPVNGYLFAGFIPVPPYASNDTPKDGTTTSPLNFHIAVTMTPNGNPPGGIAAGATCFDDAGGTLTFPGYVSFACVINVDTATAWSGTTSFLPAAPTVNWGTFDGQWFVCRYIPGKPIATYPYRNVAQSLENQNYALVKGETTKGKGKGGAGATCPQVSIVTTPATTLVQHQPPP